ncbi:General substrate transporter [Niveomyces insectorum RCEF 264]|uniref:General substrate transporter n=1 Tax=Niveomyces insectorum RCEF 264 TaxID=1081102 RepID=A0A167WZV1_9HYPO|nr:General substrate transporter [Niveomyces insectorum RCEF 264]
MTQERTNVEAVEDQPHGPVQERAEAHEQSFNPEGLLMRSKEDDIGIWKSVLRHKRVGFIAMAAAFCASLDGYQINLNSGIVANKGFIRQMANPGKTIIEGTYVSAWGGIQSTGQTVGQILLQYATEAYGRKPALIIIWVILTGSIFTESFATRWDHWLVAKLLSGMGVGMLQSTMPLYLSEIAPTQLRGYYINAYSLCAQPFFSSSFSWFVIGQLFASVALNSLNASDPYNFRTPIYTQWAMIGIIGIVFALLPETPWWLVSKDKMDKARKTLHTCNGDIANYDSTEQLEIMRATVAAERQLAEANREMGQWAVFKGRNLLRFIIAAWPKVAQQFVGLSVFNTYATYFFQYAGSNNPFMVTIILSCVQIISMIVTATSTDRFGRRPLTVYPYAVTVVSVLSLGIVGCFDYTTKALSSLLIFFACLATFSTTGASAIGYAYAAEVPQQRLRAQTAAWALAFSNMVAIMFSFCTPLMIHGPSTSWGVKTGFFFAGTGAVATFIAWLILPEVACRTPAEIDEMFALKVPLRKFKTFVTEVQVRADQVHEKQEALA